MKTGTRMLPIPAPSRASTDSARNATWLLTSDRATRPMAAAATPSVNAPAVPSLFDNVTAVAPAIAKQNPGRAVSAPARVAEQPRPWVISASTGPIEVAPGRRMIAIAATATTPNHANRVALGNLTGESSQIGNGPPESDHERLSQGEKSLKSQQTLESCHSQRAVFRAALYS